MWGSFIIACIVGLVVILVPGMLALRSLRFSWASALACAAPVSAVLVTMAGVVCQRVGIVGAPSVALATLALTGVLCALCFGIPALRARAMKRAVEPLEASPVRWQSIALYAVVNIALMGYLYIYCLASPESVISFGDNDYHLTVVKAMMDGGSFSTLAVSQYPTTLASGEVPLLDTGYYPACWHAMTALMGSLGCVSAPMAENVSLLLFTGVVFPLSVVALLQRMFPQNRSVVFWGAFAVCACVAFPLRPLLVHQIYPTVAGFACMLAAVSLFFGGVKPQVPKGARWRFAVAFAFAYIGLAVLHPSAFLAATVFLFVIMLFVVVVPRARSFAARRSGMRKGVLVVLAAIVWVLLGIVAWLLVLDSAALYSTTHFLWEWTVPAWQALLDVLDLGLRLGTPQYVLAIMVWCGFGWCCKHREYLWLAVSALLFCLIFFANAAGDPTIKRLFAGFWYTDPERTSALVAVAVAPLTAIGLSMAAHGANWLFGRLIPSWRDAASEPAAQRILAAALVLVLFLPLNYLAHLVPLPAPGLNGASGFSATRYALRQESDSANVLIYDADEHAFVDEVQEALGDDADELILNMPYDGSLYAYPEDDLNVYYKSHLNREQETDVSALIREKLDEIAVDDAVRDAVEATGARYVLKLYQDPASNDDRNKWKPEEWAGFDELTDDTPGFEVVLANGDMRLYRITALN